MRSGDYRGWGEWQFNIGVFEIVLPQSRSMGTNNYPDARSTSSSIQVFPVNMLLEDLHDFDVIFLIDSRLCRHKVLIKRRALVVKEHDYDPAHGLLLPDVFFLWFMFLFQCSLPHLVSGSHWCTQVSSHITTLFR